MEGILYALKPPKLKPEGYVNEGIILYCLKSLKLKPEVYGNEGILLEGDGFKKMFLRGVF